MDDALLVGRLQRFGDLPRDGDRLLDRQRTLLQSLRQGRPLDELHDQRLRAIRFLEAEDRGDVRVVKLRQELGLALEPAQEVVVVGERLRQHLDGHLALEPRVGGAPHLAHPALAQLGGDFVGA